MGDDDKTEIIHKLDRDLAVLYERVERLFADAEKARLHQFNEYARRLEELNGKAAQDEKDRKAAILLIKDMDNKFVSAAHFEDKMEGIERRLVIFQTFVDQSVGRNSRATLVSTVALAVSIIVVGINIAALFMK